jgi:hypothetical protein
MNLQKGGQGDINLHKFKKKWLVQVEPKWCIDKPQANQTHKTHHGLNLEKNHHFFSYNILCDKWQGYTKMTKIPKTPKES